MNDKLLEKHVGIELYRTLMICAKKYKLRFDRKGDLIKILEYYSELIN